MAILEKIQKVRSELVVEKTGWDDKNEYAYWKADDVAAGVRAATVGAGIVHRTEILNIDIDNFWDTNGRNRPRVTAHVRVVFIDAEDGSEMPTEVLATGSDVGGDKSTRKLMVQAFKEACIDVFTIAEGMSGMDSDSYAEAEPIKSEQPAEPKSRSSKEIGQELTDLINDPEFEHITGPVAMQVGQKVSDEVLGEGKKPAEWKKDARVLVELIDRLKKGEVG